MNKGRTTREPLVPQLLPLDQQIGLRKAKLLSERGCDSMSDNTEDDRNRNDLWTTELDFGKSFVDISQQQLDLEAYDEISNSHRTRTQPGES